MPEFLCAGCGKTFKNLANHKCPRRDDILNAPRQYAPFASSSRYPLSNRPRLGLPKPLAWRGIETVTLPPPPTSPQPAPASLPPSPPTPAPVEPDPPIELPPTPRYVSSRGREIRPAPKFRGMVSLESPLPHYGPRSITPPIEEDFLPSSPSLPSRSPTPKEPTPEPINPEVLITEPNCFGLYRVYPHPFTYEPDSVLTEDKLITLGDHEEPIGPAPPVVETLSRPSMTGSINYDDIDENKLGPFKNKTELMFYTSYEQGPPGKSIKHMQHMLNTITREDFDVEELKGLNAVRINKDLDEFDWGVPTGWKKAAVKLKLPNDHKLGRKKIREKDAEEFPVEGLLYRPLVDIMREFIQNENKLHYTPYKLYRKGKNGAPDQRVYHELYDSDDFNQEHIAIRNANKHRMRDGKPIETVIFAVIEYSDSTSLCQFGEASIWPFYIMSGNISKYETSKLSNGLVYHHAYMPKLSAKIQDALNKAYGEVASDETLTFLRRDLAQRVLHILLEDPEVKKAYDEGIELECSDGIWRLWFLRFFLYCCDYAEKSLIFGIKQNGKFPCPRCLVKKAHAHLLGTLEAKNTVLNEKRVDTQRRRDRVEKARGRVFNGASVGSKDVQSELERDSLTPNRNTWSEFLFERGKDFYQLPSSDILHEFETGVWKAVVIHLLRILHGLSGDRIVELDRRLRNMPTFGRGTIRRFRQSTSALKQMAARDYEDLLQVSCAAFEGLFPEPHDRLINELLYTFSVWHALAKLRMHTEETIRLLDQVTTALGAITRKFVDTTCEEFRYVARELKHEIAARGRRRAAARASVRSKGKQKVTEQEDSSSDDENEQEERNMEPPRKRRRKEGLTLNINTFKFHSLGHYVPQILRTGPADLSTSQRGELEHCRAKDHAERASNANKTEGVARREARERNVRRITKPSKNAPVVDLGESSGLPNSLDFSVDYQISANASRNCQLVSFITDNERDPAFKNFDTLYHHLYSRVTNDTTTQTFTNDQLQRIFVTGSGSGIIGLHKVIRINYRTYDLQRDSDSLNPRTNSDAMILNSHEGYNYCRIITIFHVMVYDNEDPTCPPLGRKYDVAYVRWFRSDPTWQSGLKYKRLERLEFYPKDDPQAFGFIDPAYILRAVHLQNADHYGKTDEFLGPSKARRPEDENLDFRYYYVGLFSDRDLFMRFLGCGVGHTDLLPIESADGIPDYVFEDEDDEEEEVGEDQSLVEEGLNLVRSSTVELEDEDINSMDEEEGAYWYSSDQDELENILGPEGRGGPTQSFMERVGYGDY